MPISRPLRRPVTRRTTLVAAPLLVAAGCKWTEDGTESVPEPTEPAVDADDALVREALDAMGKTAGVVERVSSTRIGLSALLADLSDLHRGHATALEGRLPDAGPGRGTRVPGNDKAAVALVVQHEQRLQATLVRLAGKAASGPLAGALASMGAGIAQQLVVLREARVGKGGGA